MVAGRDDIKRILLMKPDGYVNRYADLPEAASAAVDAAAAKATAATNATAAAAEALCPTAKQRRRAAMEAWRTDCRGCGAELDAHTALYCRGEGPLCQECIEEDPRFEGYKIEAESEGWR